MSNNFLQKYLTPAVVVGFGIAALLSTPGIQVLFFFILPAGGFFALKFDLKLNPEKYERLGRTTFRIGLATGFFSAFFMTIIEVISTMIFRTNNLVQLLPEAVKVIQGLGFPESEQSITMLNNMSNAITQNGFSGLYTFIYFFSNSITNIIFCLAGSFLFTFIDKRRNSRP